MRKILTAGALTAMGLAGLVTPAVADVSAASVCSADVSDVTLAGDKITGSSTVTCTGGPNELTQFQTYIQIKTATGWDLLGSPAQVARYGSFTHVTHVAYPCVKGTHTYMLSATGRSGRMPWVVMSEQAELTC